MTRPENDNELLRKAEETAMCVGIVATALSVLLLGTFVGCLWYIGLLIGVSHVF